MSDLQLIRDAIERGKPISAKRAAELLAELEALRTENTWLRQWLRGELTISDAEIDQGFAEWKATERP